MHASCQGSRTRNTTAAHELGHLLGAEHYTNSPSTRIVADAQAFIDENLYPMPFGNKKIRTFDASAVTNTAELVGFCDATLPPLTIQGRCLRKAQYSNQSFGGSETRRNSSAVDLTAISVANYRQGGEPAGGGGGSTTQCSDGADNDGDNLVDLADPDCSGPSDDDETGPPPPPAPPGCNPLAFAPVNVSATPLGLCHPPSDGSLYNISWNHACPPDYFVVRGVQPGLISDVGPIFGYSVTVYVDGPPAAVTVRACEGFFCSAPSSPPVFVFDTC